MQLVLGSAGALVGGLIGGPFGAQAGWALGSLAGALLDPPKGPTIEGPRLADKTVQASTYGLPIPWVWGMYRLSGNVIWATDLVEVRSEQETGGKGSGPSSTQISYQYFGNFAVAICRGPIAGVGRIWADSKLIYGGGGFSKYAENVTIYLGTEDQLPDPTIEAHLGAGNVPAYRGTAYIVFSNLPLADFGNRIPIISVEVVTANASLTYDRSFVWTSNYAAVNSVGNAYRALSSQLDKFGNLILNQHTLGTHAIGWAAADGTVLFDLTTKDLADAVDAWAGSAIVNRGTGYADNSRLHIAPIVGGEYLIALFRAGHSINDFAHWVVILEPSADGVPKVLGAVFYVTFAGVPWGMQNNFVVLESGLKTDRDPLLVFGFGGLSAVDSGIAVLPSVVDIVSGRYVAGWNNVEPYYVPYTSIYPIGNANLSHNLYSNTTSNGSQPNLQGGFTLPGGAGGTSFYLYLNRGLMEYEATNPIDVNPEIHDNIQPSYPNGAMVRIDLPPLTDFESVAGTPLTANGYTIDNDNWINQAGTPVVPFTDEYTYLSTGAAGGVDTYQMQPSLLQKRADGSWFVGFNMSGVSDSHANLGDASLWQAVRLFIYNPLSRKFSQLGRIAGMLYTAAELGSSFGALLLDNQQLIQIDGDDLYVLGYVEGAKIAYKAHFGSPNLKGYVTLAQIVGDISAACGLDPDTDFDVTDLESTIVIGSLVGRESTGRQAIDPLRAVYFFDGPESDGKIKYRIKTGVPIASVTEDDLAAREEQGDADQSKVTETRRQDYEIPSKVILHYAAQRLDYQQGVQQAKRPSGAAHMADPTTLEVAVVFDDTEAKQRVEKSLYQLWIERNQLSANLPPWYIVYDAGDVLTIPYDGVSAAVYLTQTGFGLNGVVAMEGVTTDSIIYQDSPSTGVSPTVPGQGGGVVETMRLDIIDGPLLRDQDDVPGEYVAGSGQSDSWRGGVVCRSPDNITFEQIVSIPRAAAAGNAVNVLAAAAYGPCLFDRVNTVRVSLDRSDLTLSNASEIDVLNGANTAMLGDELIGFARANLVSPGVYDLSVLLRYRQGTEWATHAVGDRFVLLQRDGSTQAVSRAIGELGRTDYWRGVSIGGSVEAVSSDIRVFRSNRLKPLAAINLEAGRDTYGNANITWTPRARTNVEIIDGADTGNDEDVEAYDVEIYSGATLKRTLRTFKPAAFYRVEDQVTDFGSAQSSLSIKVYQLSTRVGRGYGASATV